MKIKKPRNSQYRDEAMADVTKEKPHRINLDIPKEKFNRFKAAVAIDTKEKSMTKLLNRLIDEYIKKSSNEEIKESSNEDLRK